MTPLDPCIFLVDDDRSVLSAFSRLLGAAGYRVHAFSSPRDFLAEHDVSVPGCALLDVGMDEIDGLSLQESLHRLGSRRPVIFITGQDDVASGVRAMKAGALDYLTKPVEERVLLDTVDAALALDRERRCEEAEMAALGHRAGRLTAREREVMAEVVRGRLNKQIAHDLGIVEKTVKVHRARVMEKMQIRSVAELVLIVQRLKLSGGGC